MTLDKDYTIVPNQWNVLGGYLVPSSSGRFVMVVMSPTAAPSGTWYVDGTRMNAYQASIYLNGTHDIVVRGLDVESTWRGFELRNGADHNEISESSFTNLNVFSANIIWNASGAPSSNNWIHDCVFHDAGYVKRTDGVTRCDDVMTLLRVGNDAGTDNSSFNLIENNTFYHGGHDLVLIATKFNTFRNNILHNEGWIENREGPCQDADGDPYTFNNPSKFGNRGLILGNPRNNGGHNLIEGNRIGFAGTPPDDDGANGIENPSDGNIVRYNFLFKNGMAGYYFKAQPGISGIDVLPDDNVIYNNTIYRNGGGQDVGPGYQGGLTFICGGSYWPPHPTGNMVKNNIVYDNAIPVRNRACAGYTYVDNFEGDPLFVNPDLSDPFSARLPDLNLQSRSPAIDRAAPLTTVRSDDAGRGITLAVEDARYFQDGRWAPAGKISPDVIAVGRPSNTAAIAAVDYARNVIVLTTALRRTAGGAVWLHARSDGSVVLVGAGPDFGASESRARGPGR